MKSFSFFNLSIRTEHRNLAFLNLGQHLKAFADENDKKALLNVPN